MLHIIASMIGTVGFWLLLQQVKKHLMNMAVAR